MNKLNPKQREFLRKRLGPALLRAVPGWLSMVPKVRAHAAKMGGEAPKLEPFSFGLMLALIAPLSQIGAVIRSSVREGLDPEEVHALVSVSVLDVLKVLLKDETEDQVIGLYTLVSSEVDAVFSSSGLWKALNEADDVFASEPAPPAVRPGRFKPKAR